MVKKRLFTIGEFMQKSGVSIRTLRYYDSINLIKPSDYTEGGHRLYSTKDLSTLQQIKSLQFLGFSLKDIKNMLQKNTAKGSDLWKSLNDQKQLFETKKHEITKILSDLDHLMKTIEGEETVHINIFCMILQKLMFEEDTKKWVESHFAKDITDELLDRNKTDEIYLDKRWAKILSDINHLTQTAALPSSDQSQLIIKSLMELMEETTRGNVDVIQEKLLTSEPFPFPDPFTEKEVEFLREAMEIYQKDNSSFKGDLMT